jgi:hypothetical protein
MYNLFEEFIECIQQNSQLTCSLMCQKDFIINVKYNTMLCSKMTSYIMYVCYLVSLEYRIGDFTILGTESTR